MQERVPSLPDGNANVVFDKTTSGNQKVVLSIPTWFQGTKRDGTPVIIRKYKRINVTDKSLVDRFLEAYNAGWFREVVINDQGDKVQQMELANIRYFDNSFQDAKKNWINFSQLVSCDIIEVADPDEY